MARPNRRHRTRARQASATAGVAILALVLSACGGTRVTMDEIVAAQGRVVSAATAAPAAGQVAEVASGAVPAPVADAPATTPGAVAPAPAAATGSAATPKAGSAKTPAGSPAKAGTAKSTGGSATKADPKVATSAAGAGAVTPTTACTKQGPPIVLGQVVSASGIIGANVGSAIPALAAWSKYINANGGIACHPVQVIAQDDASDPSRASAAVSDLVSNRKAVAMVGNFVPLSISGFKSAIDKNKVPAIGGDLFSTAWWQDPLFYPVGTFLDANAYGSSAALAKQGAKKVAVLYCIEAAACPPYKDAVVNNAAKGGYEIVYNQQVSITSPDYTSQCQSAKNAGADQINMIVEGSGVSRVARSCASIGYFPKFAVASLGATFDPGDKNVQKVTATIASAANNWFSSETKGQKQFQDAMKRYAPTLQLDPTAPLAWATAMMVKKAIENLGDKAIGVAITTDMIRDGLAKVKDETLDGMILPNSFSPDKGVNPKNMCYYTNTFSAPGQWKKASVGCLK